MKQWIITSMECKPKEGDLNNVVVSISWTRLAKEQHEEKEYTATLSGRYSVPLPIGSDFTPYSQLTQEQVESWLNDAGNSLELNGVIVNVETLDANLDGLIENQTNPPVVKLPLPWIE